MKEIIYVDMDGVLSDFENRYRELFNHEPGEKRDDKFSDRWRLFIDGNNFATLETFPGYKELLTYLDSIPLQKAILSSTGGFNDHNNICKQKTKWLKDHNINYPAIFVPGKQFKSGYANSKSVLIDDTLSIITSFSKAGGSAIHHIDVNETINYMENWLND